MPAKFAGQPLLLEDPGGILHRWHEWTLDPARLGAFTEPIAQVDSRLDPRSDAYVGLPRLNYTPPPPLRVNSLWIPTGATRWAQGLFLTNSSTLAKINTALDSDGKGTLEFESGHTYIMYPMPPYLLNVGTTDDLYLLPLVDQRYFWQYQDTGPLALTDSTTWADILSALSTLLGTTIATSTIESAYGQPAVTAMTRRYENIATMLDAVAACLGMRVVFDARSEAVAMMNAADALVFHNLNLAAHQSSIMAGGANAQPLRNQIPSQVRVVFPKQQNGHRQDDADVYVVTVTAADILGSSQLTQLSNSTKTFHETAEADMTNSTSTPDNLTALTALATQIATDYYAWLKHTYDVSYAGLRSWVPNGLDDWLLLNAGVSRPADGEVFGVEGMAHGDYDYSTRVCAMPYNLAPSELTHAPTSHKAEKCLRRFELYENLTFGSSAQAYRLDFDGDVYAVDEDELFTVHDPFSKFNQNHAPYDLDGARGYAVFIDGRWEIVELQHQARWIEFVINTGSGFDTTDASVAVDGVTYHEGYQPVDDVVLVYNKKTNGDFMFEGEDDDEGMAKYDPATDRYTIWQLECPAGAGGGSLMYDWFYD